MLSMLVTHLSGTTASLELSIAVLAIVHGRNSSSLPNAFVWGSFLRGWDLDSPHVCQWGFESA